MPICVKRLDSPSSETLKPFLDGMQDRETVNAASDPWSTEALAELPKQLQAFAAYDSDDVVGLLLLCPGVFEPWGVPVDLLGANPILPIDQGAKIHAALLVEAKTWALEENLSGLEIALPMGSANMQRDEHTDAFHEKLDFDRFYYTMTRELGSLDSCSEADFAIKTVPTATIPTDELTKNFAACVAHGEIEFMSKLSEDDRREYFDSLAEDTLNHQGSLALTEDDRLLGFTLAATTSETIAHLAWIGVLPDHRSKGLGRQLLCRVMETCRNDRINTMSLYTDTDVGAQTLYHGLGFVPAGALIYRWRRPIE